MSEAPALPDFEIRMEPCGRGWLAVVPIGKGLSKTFYSPNPDRARRYAEAFIAEQRSRFLKSLAAKEARKAGRHRQSLRASSEPETRMEGE